jgi:hypothetical protein
MVFPLLMHGDVPVVELRHITCATPDGVAEESFWFRSAADHTVPAFSVFTPVSGPLAPAVLAAAGPVFSELDTRYWDNPVVELSSWTT